MKYCWFILQSHSLGVKTEQFAPDDNDGFMDSDFGPNDLDDCNETGEFSFFSLG